MKPATLLRLIIRPTLSELTRYDTKPGLTNPEAELLMVAIAIQESGIRYRRQINGPARSFWQIEPPTYHDTLLRYTPLQVFADNIDLGMSTPIDASYALRYNDALGCACARGILRLNPKPLPAIGDEAEAWKYYLENWHPGKPRPDEWALSYWKAYDSAGHIAIRKRT